MNKKRRMFRDRRKATGDIHEATRFEDSMKTHEEVRQRLRAVALGKYDDDYETESSDQARHQTLAHRVRNERTDFRKRKKGREDTEGNNGAEINSARRFLSVGDKRIDSQTNCIEYCKLYSKQVCY